MFKLNTLLCIGIAIETQTFAHSLVYRAQYEPGFCRTNMSKTKISLAAIAEFLQGDCFEYIQYIMLVQSNTVARGKLKYCQTVEITKFSLFVQFGYLVKHIWAMNFKRLKHTKVKLKKAICLIIWKVYIFQFNIMPGVCQFYRGHLIGFQ